jgi:hypothetical protein
MQRIAFAPRASIRIDFAYSLPDVQPRRMPHKGIAMRAMTIWKAALVALPMLLTACDDDDDRTPPMPANVAPTITAPAAALADGIVDMAATPVTVAASGTAPITYTITSGALPPGLIFNAQTGVYSGTPTTPGSYAFTITAANSAGSDSRAFTQAVFQRPAITGPVSPLVPGVAGSAYTAMLFSASGSMPLTFSVSAGALPPGLTLDAAGGYSGTPTTPGDFSFTITATNPVGAASREFTQQVRAPALDAHALVGGNSIAAFATTFPQGMQAPLALTGVIAGDTIVSIDRRPQNGFLYGIGYNATAGTAQLYSISGTTGFATPIGATGSFVAADGVTPVAVGAGAGTSFGVDFNPTVDRVRVVNGAGQNFRINPNTGAFVDGNTAIANINMDGGINGATSSVQETAYTNSAPGATVTTQYTLDAGTDAVCIQNPPNAGTQGQCQSLDSAIDAVLGLDIDPGVTTAASNTPVTAGAALAVVKLAGQGDEVLANIDLTNGAVTSLGALGGGGISGLAVQRPSSTPFIGLSADGLQLARFTRAAPEAATAVTVTGVAAGEMLVGIDFRPQTGQLFGLGVADAADTATLYLLDPQTGAATAVGAVGQIAFMDAAGTAIDLPPATSGYGFDFNPTVDRIRVTTGTGLNFRVNPNNGAPVDGNLNNTAAPPANTNPDAPINGLPGGSTGVSGAAYTNSFGQSLTGGVTTQYVIDAGSDSLYVQNPPNSGAVAGGIRVMLDGLPLDFSVVNGFDIPSDVRTTASGMPATSGTAFAALTVAGVQRLFAIDLVNGWATDIGLPAIALSGLAVGQVALQ